MKEEIKCPRCDKVMISMQSCHMISANCGAHLDCSDKGLCGNQKPGLSNWKFSAILPTFSFIKFDITELWTLCKHTMHRSYSIRGMSWNQVYMHMWHFLSAFFSIMNSYQRRWRYALHSSAYDSYTFEKVSVIHIGHFLNFQIMSLWYNK